MNNSEREHGGPKMLDRMKALAREKDHCVLATVSDNQPHCSLMAYVTDDDCREIYMVTHKNTKKFENLLKNPAVSILIDSREEKKGKGESAGLAMTVAGEFKEMENERKRERIREKILERHPHLRSFMDDPEAEILCIRVISLLLLNGLTDAHFEVL